jgi:CIC family chloride channel protein
LKAGGGGLILGGAVLLGLPHLYGVGYEPASQLLSGGVGLKLMLVLIAAKMLASALSLGSGFTGGIFAPTLLIGGALGGVVGELAGTIFPAHASPTGAYALVGMAALMAGVTHAPITAILILFEMTGGYEIILPLMTACIASVVVAQRLSSASMFTLGFVRRGIDLNFGRESAILRDYFAEDLMHPTVPTLPLRASFETIVESFLTRQENRYFVVDEHGRLKGVVDIHDIKQMVQEQGLGGVIMAADLMRPVEQQLQRRENLEDAILLLSSTDADDLPVVKNNEDPVLVGWISRKDILELYNREILHKEILGIKLVHRDTKGTDFVDLPEQYKVDLISVSGTLQGQSLAQLDLRGRYGVHVLAIKRPGSRAAGHNELPDPSVSLTKRDRLIVVGRSEDVERLRAELETHST